MKFPTTFMAAALCLAALPALAETIEVKMLNRGEGGSMVFEPEFVSAQVGDTIKFLATDRGHNAETVKGMVPEGQEAFIGKINEEIEVPLTAEGLTGIKCKPHLGMGMVMVVQVGDADVSDDFLEARMPGRAKKKFESILSEAGLN